MIYAILAKRETTWNPLTEMMSRNLKVFAKIIILMRK